MIARKVPLLLFLYSSSSVGGWCLCLKAFSHRYRHHHFFSSSQLFEKKINRESNVLANAVNVALIGNMKIQIQNTNTKKKDTKYKKTNRESNVLANAVNVALIGNTMSARRGPTHAKYLGVLSSSSSSLENPFKFLN